MRRTLNEIYRLCQKSTEGAGAPPGLDVEAAKSAAWLAAHGLPALDDLAGELDLLADSKAGSFGHGEANGRLDARGKAGALLAPLLVERLVATVCDEPRLLEIQALSSPLYLLPAAARYARSGFCFDFVLRSPRGETFHIVVSEENGLTIQAPADTDIAVFAGGVRFDMVAQCRRATDPVTEMDTTDNALLLSEDALMRAESESIAHGIEVDEEIWHRLSMYAAKVLVPATDTSRRGAGTLSSDNE